MSQFCGHRQTGERGRWIALLVIYRDSRSESYTRYREERIR